jgi:hypothetical protein
VYFLKLFILCTLVTSNSPTTISCCKITVSETGYDSLLKERNNVTNILGQSSIVYSLVDGKIVLKWILKKWDVGAWTRLLLPRIGTGGGLL